MVKIVAPATTFRRTIAAVGKTMFGIANAKFEVAFNEAPSSRTENKDEIIPLILYMLMESCAFSQKLFNKIPL